jgi:hypothetical protein
MQYWGGIWRDGGAKLCFSSVTNGSFRLYHSVPKCHDTHPENSVHGLCKHKGIDTIRLPML